MPEIKTTFRVKPEYTIAVVQKAARVLQVLSNAPRAATLTEIALTAKLPKNTVFRILNTFLAAGFVGRAEDRWFLGQGLIALIERDLENKLKRWERRDHELDGACP